MASGPTLPPQAYTREILTAAFNWLQTQPESVKKLATTPDALVGLYLRAQRFGNSNLESDAPVSSQAFMSDLKNLAEGLKQFEEPAREARRAAQHIPQQMQQAQMSFQQQPPSHTPPPNSAINVALATALASQHSRETLHAFAGAFGGLNERSLAMIQEVKTHLNLASDADAINMMVALAYKNLKNLLA